MFASSTGIHISRQPEVQVPPDGLAEEDLARASLRCDLARERDDVADQVRVSLRPRRAEDLDRRLASVEPEPDVDRRKSRLLELGVDRVADQPPKAVETSGMTPSGSVWGMLIARLSMSITSSCEK